MRILNRKYWPARAVYNYDQLGNTSVQQRKWCIDNNIKHIVFTHYDKIIFNFANTEDCMLFKLRWGQQ